MRWLAHRGGALDFTTSSAHAQNPRPSRIPWPLVMGADPATILGARYAGCPTPSPNTVPTRLLRRRAARTRESCIRPGVTVCSCPRGGQSLWKVPISAGRHALACSRGRAARPARARPRVRTRAGRGSTMATTPATKRGGRGSGSRSLRSRHTMRRDAIYQSTYTGNRR